MRHQPRLAYVFERFPSFSQTFCFREVRELIAQKTAPLLFSIRRPTEEPPQEYPPEFSNQVTYLPPEEELVAEMKAMRESKKMPRKARKLLENWSGKDDRHRVYEAVWLAPRLRKAGIKHVHVHFAGMAARTAYWLHRLFGFSFSFTGHANDIFCEESDLPVSLGDLVQRARLVVTVSDFSRQLLAKRFPREAGKFHRVYNGIDTALWKPAPEREEGLILSIGRLIEKKGFADLIRACSRLRKRQVPFRCVIVGEGPLEATLRALIESEGLAGHVELAGPLPQDRIRELLPKAKVFALPCIEEPNGAMDNLPTVIMEALSCGVPCVSTAVGGIPEMIRISLTGLIVPQHNTIALADALNRLITNAELNRLQSNDGRLLAEEIFDIRVTTRELKRLFVRRGCFHPTMGAIQADLSLLSDGISGLIRGA